MQVLALENQQLKNPETRGRSLSAVPPAATPRRSPSPARDLPRGPIAYGHGDQLPPNGLAATARPDFIDRAIGTALTGPLRALPDPELTCIAAKPLRQSTW